MSRPLFLLGTHQPGWLRKARVPLFVSDRRLKAYKTLPVAAAPWAVDSGGFTELQPYGRWTVTPCEYVARLRRYRDEIGNVLWAAPQDWMCEPAIINGGVFNGQRFAGTHLSVPEHQRRTVANYIELRELAPDLPIIPVVQGDTPDAYLLRTTTAGSCGLGCATVRLDAVLAQQVLQALDLLVQPPVLFDRRVDVCAGCPLPLSLRPLVEQMFLGHAQHCGRVEVLGIDRGLLYPPHLGQLLVVPVKVR